MSQINNAKVIRLQESAMSHMSITPWKFCFFHKRS